MGESVKRDEKLEEEFLHHTGQSLDKVVTLYKRAVENDWRTVQATSQAAINRFVASRASAAEAAELLRLSRAILAGENGEHLRLSGLDGP